MNLGTQNVFADVLIPRNYAKIVKNAKFDTQEIFYVLKITSLFS